jgi:hypothetical protein
MTQGIKTSVTWYPSERKTKTVLKKDNCPVCNGTCRRIDRRTGKERDCVACNGEGVVKK